MRENGRKGRRIRIDYFPKEGTSQKGLNNHFLKARFM